MICCFIKINQYLYELFHILHFKLNREMFHKDNNSKKEYTTLTGLNNNDLSNIGATQNKLTKSRGSRSEVGTKIRRGKRYSERSEPQPYLVSQINENSEIVIFSTV